MATPRAGRLALNRASTVTPSKYLPRSSRLQSLRCRCSSTQALPLTAGRRKWFQASAALFGISATLAVLYGSFGLQEAFAEAGPAPAELKFEEKKRKGTTKAEQRSLVSSQHLQVQRSWENPGLYAWGSNTGKVAAPDVDDAFVKTARRIPFFDGVLLKDVKLDRNFGAAITEDGDLIQWGKGYSATDFQPTTTLKGRKLVDIAISRDKIIALSSGGTVYSIPVAKVDQEGGPKLSEDSWIPFWKGRSDISYRRLQPQSLGYTEKVTQISGGLEHVLLLTNSGRVFSAASGTEHFPSKGQMGVPGLTWTTRPEGPYDICHEISTLKGFDIATVAAGDYHSFALDRDGRVFAFGDNSLGQLGFEYSSESPAIDAPSLLPIQKLYAKTNQAPKVTSVHAGGVNSFFTIDATRVAGQGENPSEMRGLGRVTADTWSCGQGLFGGLGNGRWTHVQGVPTKLQALSGLFEYDETKNTVVPIRLSRISVGSTHASAVMNNVTYLGASDKSSEHDTNWGADVLWWGGNEYYQLGTGRRNNVSNPIYIPPLDMAAEKDFGRREEHRFQITPRHKVNVNGRNVSMEQRIECGRFVTAVYSGV